jgi:Domain of unknown function (DUF4055)
VPNWRLSKDGRTIEQIPIHERVTLPDGDFGEVKVNQYRVLRPGRCDIYTEENKEVVKESFGTTLSVIPIVPYCASISDGNPFGGRLPLLDLAELNLKHYRLTSDKDQVIHKCNTPILNLEELNAGKGGPAGQRAPKDKVKTGPNTALWNVRASYVEPTGRAIESTKGDIKDLETAMDRLTLDFLTKGGAQKTATEIDRAATPLSANLAGMILAKESAAEMIFDFYNLYYGNDDLTINLRVDQGALGLGMDTQTTDRVFEMRQMGDLSRETFLELVQEMRVLPPGLSISQELSRLATETNTSSNQN